MAPVMRSNRPPSVTISLSVSRTRRWPKRLPLALTSTANRKLVVHVNGAFHSDFGQGTAERVRRRLNGRRVVVVSVLPVKDLDALAPAGEDLARAGLSRVPVAEPRK